MHLGLPDASGRQSVEPLEGSHFTVTPIWSSRRWASTPRTCRGCSTSRRLPVTPLGHAEGRPPHLHDRACPASSPPATSCAARASWSGRSATAATRPTQIAQLRQGKGRRAGRGGGVTTMTEHRRDRRRTSSPPGSANEARLRQPDGHRHHGARCLRRRPGRRARRQAQAARRGAGRHRRAEGGLASRRGGRRRQDRRRRRHPYRDPAGLLRRGRAARRRQAAPGPHRGRQVFLPKTDLGAQERCRQIVETEILNFGYAIYGWRQVPINVACIGEKANATRPEIEQIMIWDPEQRERGDRSSATCTSSAAGSRSRRSPRRSRSCTSARCPAARSSTRACSWRRA